MDSSKDQQCDDERFKLARAADWAEAIPDDQWQVYARVIRQLEASGIPFALGGAFALATYTHHWRNTKDLDFYILPEYREQMISLMSGCGLSDYYAVLPYERHWIYRGHAGGIIVDAIWAMANRRTDVDQSWLTQGATVQVRGHELPVIAPEEFLWAKLYILQRDRCDWGDVINVLGTVGPALGWKRLCARMGEDWPLLRGVLSVFAWVDPARAALLPAPLWRELGLPEPAQNGERERRVNFIDTRPWYFAPQCGESPSSAAD